MTNKEFSLYLIGALAITSGISTKSIETMPVKDCTAIVVEHPYVMGGLTLPWGLRDSLIFLNPNVPILKYQMLKHELAHASQICQQGGAGFIAGYLRDPMGYELDANRRMNEEKIP